jgi:hypothetical protein
MTCFPESAIKELRDSDACRRTLAGDLERWGPIATRIVRALPSLNRFAMLSSSRSTSQLPAGPFDAATTDVVRSHAVPIRDEVPALAGLAHRALLTSSSRLIVEDPLGRPGDAYLNEFADTTRTNGSHVFHLIRNGPSERNLERILRGAHVTFGHAATILTELTVEDEALLASAGIEVPDDLLDVFVDRLCWVAVAIGGGNSFMLSWRHRPRADAAKPPNATDPDR